MNEIEFKKWVDRVAPSSDALKIFGAEHDSAAKQRQLLLEAYDAGLGYQRLVIANLRAQVDGYALVFKNIQIHQNPPGFLTRLFRRIF